MRDETEKNQSRNQKIENRETIENKNETKAESLRSV